jgi:hypothetical protein
VQPTQLVHSATCNLCKMTLPNTKFTVNKTRENGLASRCTTCLNDNRRDIYHSRSNQTFESMASTEVTVKNCSKCGVLQNATEYDVDCRNTSGLQAQCKSCRNLLKKPYMDKVHSAVGRAEITSETIKCCPTCLSSKKLLEGFCNDKKSYDGHSSSCKACRSASKKVEYNECPDTFVRSRVGTHHSFDDRKSLAGGAKLSLASFLEMAAHKKCFYSGLSLSMRPWTNWQLSFERLDNSKGHVLGNTVTVCAEMQNGYTQWNKGIVSRILLGPHTEIELSRSVFKSPVRNAHTEELHFKFLKLISSARKNGVKQSRKKCTISVEDLIDKYVKQKGLCFYSGMKMEAEGTWRCSVERLDSRGPYSNENTALICLLFNSSDRSVLNDNATEGIQWSKEKVAYLRANAVVSNDAK